MGEACPDIHNEHAIDEEELDKEELDEEELDEFQCSARLFTLNSEILSFKSVIETITLSFMHCDIILTSL